VASGYGRRRNLAVTAVFKSASIATAT